MLHFYIDFNLHSGLGCKHQSDKPPVFPIEVRAAFCLIWEFRSLFLVFRLQLVLCLLAAPKRLCFLLYYLNVSFGSFPAIVLFLCVQTFLWHSFISFLL